MKYQKTEIKKRTDGRWYARYKLYPCIYKDIYGKTQLECYEKLKEFADNKKLINNMVKKLNEPMKIKKTTFKEFYNTWLKQEKIPNCKESTIRAIKSKYKNYLHVLDNRPIADITANEIRELLLNIELISVRSRCQTILQDLFRQAVNYDLISNSIMTKLSPCKYKATPLEPLSHKEELLFIKYAENSPCALIFALMLYEGLRTSEAKAITPSDIKDKYIVVNKSIDDSGNFIPTKTSTTRQVPIFNKFKPYADKYRGESKLPCLGKVNKHTAVNEYKEIQILTGIEKRMYTLRHTFATRCEEAGISIKQTSIWMGHSNIQTTLSSYVGIPEDFQDANIKKINNYII